MEARAGLALLLALICALSREGTGSLTPDTVQGTPAPSALLSTAPSTAPGALPSTVPGALPSTAPWALPGTAPSVPRTAPSTAPSIAEALPGTAPSIPGVLPGTAPSIPGTTPSIPGVLSSRAPGGSARSVLSSPAADPGSSAETGGVVCNCTTIGSVCNTTGQCDCLPGYVGLSCDVCAEEFYQNTTRGLCVPCNCSAKGTSHVLCD
ncbi:hypothetical protein FKM82_018492, partial [Ascaphus truei]